MNRPARRWLGSMIALVGWGGRRADSHRLRALALAACVTMVASFLLPIEAASAATPLPVSNVEVTAESSTTITLSSSMRPKVPRKRWSDRIALAACCSIASTKSCPRKFGLLAICQSASSRSACRRAVA